MLRSRSKLLKLCPMVAMRTAQTTEQLRRLITSESADDQLYDAFEQLSYVDQQVLIRYYSLGGGGHRTLKEIGDEVGLSNELVRQVRVRAERRFREKLRTLPDDL